jgi:FixJ family two-component response regulator
VNDEGPIVFVVDDDWSIRESLKNLLRSAELTAQTSASAQEVLSGGLEGWRQAGFTVEPLEQVSLRRS